MVICRPSVLDSEEWKLATDNKAWSLEADRDIMLWTTTYPQDWQVGGKCDAYFWGNGRHGQLSEGGTRSIHLSHGNIRRRRRQ